MDREDNRFLSGVGITICIISLIIIVLFIFPHINNLEETKSLAIKHCEEKNLQYIEHNCYTYDISNATNSEMWRKRCDIQCGHIYVLMIN